MPDYFNELKLLVVPSYSEGLPGTLLEAMACGTPALATPVGGIAEVIKDGETGFLLPDNSPQSIAQNVIRVLNYPNLAQIADNARALIEREYSFQAAVERYRRILYGVT
jgi:glycosyltransferase involved in cell wall biosynthesis